MRNKCTTQWKINVRLIPWGWGWGERENINASLAARIPFVDHICMGRHCGWSSESSPAELPLKWSAPNTHYPCQHAAILAFVVASSDELQEGTCAHRNSVQAAAMHQNRPISGHFAPDEGGWTEFPHAQVCACSSPKRTGTRAVLMSCISEPSRAETRSRLPHCTRIGRFRVILP